MNRDSQATKDLTLRINELSKKKELTKSDIKYIYKVAVGCKSRLEVNNTILDLKKFNDVSSVTPIINKLYGKRGHMNLSLDDRTRLKKFNGQIKSSNKFVREASIKPSDIFDKSIEEIPNILNYTNDDVTAYSNMLITLPLLERIYAITLMMDMVDEDGDITNYTTISVNVSRTITNVNRKLSHTILDDSIVEKNIVLEGNPFNEFKKYILYLLRCIHPKLTPINIKTKDLKEIIIGNLYWLISTRTCTTIEAEEIKELVEIISSYLKLPSFKQYNRMITIEEFI